MSRTILVLGGAGFIGSHVAERFHRGGDRVVVLDGLVPGTGGREENLRGLADDVRVIWSRVEEAPDLPALVEQSEVIVDAMAWTAHHLAQEAPLRDLELNVASHLHVLRCLQRRGEGRKTIVYLGSRGQYGKPASSVITEETPMVPEDVQGIHKLSAESYYRVFARQGRFDALSLRFGNCVGARQPREGSDIGLIGGLLRDLLAGRTVEIYGGRRTRYIVYAPDVAEVVFQLASRAPRGFSAFNYAGHAVSIEELVVLLQEIVGRGDYRLAEMPEEVARLDVGEARFCDDRLKAELPSLPTVELRAALTAAVRDFEGGGEGLPAPRADLG